MNGTRNRPRTRSEGLTLSGNVICDNKTNVNLIGEAELTDTEGNEICADAPADASE